MCYGKQDRHHVLHALLTQSLAVPCRSWGQRANRDAQSVSCTTNSLLLHAMLTQQGSRLRAQTHYIP